MTRARAAPSATLTTAAARSIVMGTAGHIDHGKTALVFALTGTDTDRLPEEKSRGITIDLGFASMLMQDANGRAVDLSLIDVPGHHAFIRNMLAGAGGIDCVMLVIAANEGVKPQTEEHLAICSMLGIRHGLVVLTKKDAVSADALLQTRDEVTQFARGTFLQDAPVCAVSARTMEGIRELKVELARVLAQVPHRTEDLVMRLPLDRAFSVRGFGTVVTGTLQSGRIRAGDTLTLLPQNRTVRVRGIQVHGRTQSEVESPNRVALNVVGADASEIRRGDTLVFPNTILPTRTADAAIALLRGAPPLKHRSRVRVHAFASESLATVLLFDRDAASNERETLVRLRLEKPIVFAPGDRFVLRQCSPAITIGGGRILDAHSAFRLRKSKAHNWLSTMSNASVDEQVLARVQRRGVDGLLVSQLIAETGLTREKLAPIVHHLHTEARLIVPAEESASIEHVLSTDGLRLACALVERELARSSGKAVARAEMRSRTALSDWVLNLAIENMVRQGQVRISGGAIAPAVQDNPHPEQEFRSRQVEVVYRNAGLASPIVSEVSAKLNIEPKELYSILTSLIRAKKLVRMGSDNLLIHADALARLRTDLEKRRGESFDVARFKSFSGLTRKHAIPLLEYLDGSRITRNNNGVRIVL